MMGTLWSFRRPIDPGYQMPLKSVTLIYIIAHMTILYLYQFPFLRLFLSPDDFSSRLIGFLPITDTNCKEPPTRILLEENLGYEEIAMPLFLFILYIFMAYRHKLTTYQQQKKLYFARNPRVSRASVSERPRSATQNIPSSSSGSQNDAVRSGRSVTIAAKSQARRQTPVPEENEETMRLLNSDNQAVVNSLGEASVTSSQIDDSPNKVDQGAEGPGSPSRPFNFLPFIPDAANKFFRRGESTFLPPISPLPPPQVRLSPIDTLYSLISAYAFVFSLLSMMIWSVTHFSILTLVLLVAACMLWLVPNTRRACVIASPLIVFYSIFLILVGFIYGINLTDAELKSYKEIGLVRYGDTHPLMLAAEILYTLPFLLLLRQRVDKHLASGNLNVPSTSSKETANAVTKAIQMLLVTTAISERKSVLGSQVELNRFVLKFITFLLEQLSVYWIFLCFILILIQACTGETTIINLVYMFLFLTTSFFFIVSFRIWRRLLFVTCWFLCLYSMIVLLAIYIYQFEEVEKWLDVNTTSHLYIGLSKYNTAPALFRALILPAMSLMALVLQVQFFHHKLLKMTEKVAGVNIYAGSGHDEISETDDADSHENSIASNLKGEYLIEAEWWKKLSDIMGKILQYCFRSLEVHIFKVVMIFAACLAITQVSAVNLPMFLAVVSLLPLFAHRNGTSIISVVVYLGVCVAVLSKMGFQLELVQEYSHYFVDNCTVINPDNSTSMIPRSLIDWLGLEKSNNMLEYLQLYIILIVLCLVQQVWFFNFINLLTYYLLLALLQIVYVRQDIYYYHNEESSRPPPGVIFPHISRVDADQSVFSLIMFFVNYGFYKFGLELVWISTTIVIATRMDAFSLIYSLPLVAQMFMPRRVCASFYPFYVCSLVVILLAQYCACVGFPFYFTCGSYPWEDMEQQLRLWLMLPISNSDQRVDCTKLIGDFIQLLLAVCQLSVFRIEAQHGGSGETYPGGDNSDALPNPNNYYNNPVHDFISEKKYVFHH